MQTNVAASDPQGILVHRLCKLDSLNVTSTLVTAMNHEFLASLFHPSRPQYWSIDNYPAAKSTTNILPSYSTIKLSCGSVKNPELAAYTW